MDRLSALTHAALYAVLLASAACNERREALASSSRYEAVKAAAEPVSHWCDSAFADPAPRLTLPPLAPQSGAKPPTPVGLSKGKRVWVNLWATWCGPCLRELPLLLKWQRDLRADGVDVDVLLLSLDDDAQAFDKFLAEHKEVSGSKVARVVSQSAYEEWVKGYLKDPSTPIPIHFLASADGNLRCIRSGSLREGDYRAAKAALR